ncbi:MAG TPA: DUF3352 domain-containing protein [Solirubrobacteraceae bacterium]|nr:DUF3352 domain-containing protein [Solirubrobacteraceae bacterium]
MSAAPAIRRRRAALGLAILVAVVLIVVLAATSGGGSSAGQAPANGAAAVVPADALLYVHLSTDASRPATRRALALVEKFPGFPLLAARLGSALTGSGAISLATGIRPWLGQEAALALLDNGTSAAAPLIVLGVADHARAEAFLARIGARPAGSYDGASLYARRGAMFAFASHYLVLGAPASVRAALDAATGHAASLGGDGTYKSAVANEPADRVLDVYASAVGVRRLLVDQGGLTGALGVLLYSPALNGVTMSLSADPPGARVQIQRVLDPHLAAITGPPAQEITPTLESELPAGSTLALDVPDLERIAPKVLSAGATGGVGGAIGPLLSRLGAALRAQGVDVAALESLFSGESAVAISPTAGHPSALVIVSRVSNMEQARTELASVEVPLSQLLASAASSSGVVPSFIARSVGGVTAHQLILASGLELDYAVFRGLVVISTSLSGIAAVASHTHTLADYPAYKATLAGSPSKVTSLLFLNFSQLLSLSEQTGLITGARYGALRADLQKIGAIGLSSTSGETDSTAELSLQIP